ncbi:hypothetical protein GGQ99_000818 [Aminobacter niigataensis]|uniref:Uncharacterized protein n=1 Tax=Aminobacter niigataensis TaxID=83265 RepID=A0ABR6KZ66_9HYPH|nr:hypothetical protein [Aminobacter niigataensis]
MALKPFPDTGESTLIRVGRRVRAVKYSHLAKQENADARTFSFTYFGTKGDKERFDVGPPHRPADGPCKYLLQRCLMPPLQRHGE